MHRGLNRREMEGIRVVTCERLVSGECSAEEAARDAEVALRTVYRWMALYRDGGEEELAAKPHPGRPRFLMESEIKELESLLLKGAVACGFPNELWTCRRVAELISDRFGVSYHQHHIPRILSRLGWTPQKPERRAKERDEAAIELWVKRDWPRIQKKPVALVQPSSLPTSPLC